MSKQSDRANGKRSWPRPQVIDVGSVDEQTTAGTGNIGDQQNIPDKWKHPAIETSENAKAILPDGE